MAEHDCQTEIETTEMPELKNRRYTVGYIRSGKKHEQSASITLRGHWLSEAGFTTGVPVKVRVMPGCLILTAEEPLPPQPPEPEITQTLRKVCKLSARKQQKIAEFIETLSAKRLPAGKYI